MSFDPLFDAYGAVSFGLEQICKDWTNGINRYKFVQSLFAKLTDAKEVSVDCKG